MSKAEAPPGGTSSNDAAAGGSEEAGAPRRDFLARSSALAMCGGLAGSYGTFAFMAGRFLYPAQALERAWLFVTETDRLALGAGLAYRTPAGLDVSITRHGQGDSAEDFLALSSVCPHLGCRVHWEPHNERFFCPCHNGVFTPEGVASAGPPADAGQSLPRYPLKVENGMLFIEVVTEGLVAATRRSTARPAPALGSAAKEDRKSLPETA